MHSTLPDANSSSLGLVQPSHDQVLEMTRMTAVEWKGALATSEAYERREKHLSAQRLTKSGGQTYWALVDMALAPSDRQVLACCETIRKRALVARDGKVQDATSHAIGGVFTYPALRGRGYGARMMKELATSLRTWQASEGDIPFSTLYSDIGKRFYAKHGWLPFPSSHLHLAPSVLSVSNGSTPITLLESADVHKLCAIDEASIRKQLASWHGEGTAVAQVPDRSIIEWQHAREEFVAAEVLGRAPNIKGALTQLSDGRRVWCVWTRMFYNEDPTKRAGNTLHIMRLAIEEADTSSPVSDAEMERAIANLMSAAQAQADEWMCSEVELWNPSALSLAAARRLDASTTLIERESDSITSLAWYGAPEEGPVHWLANEKFGWS